MPFEFASGSTSPRETVPSSSRPRPIKSPKHIQAHICRPRQRFDVPDGPNWVHASGGSRSVRFDFSKALDEQLAAEDETCGSSQEYYARKSATSSPKGENGTFFPPVPPTYRPDPRFMYPTQRPQYAFNFDRATPADVQNMNTALPFGPSSPERKQRTRKDIYKLAHPSPPKQSPFEFGDRHTAFNAFTPSLPSHTSKTPVRTNSKTLTVRSQNHDGIVRRNAMPTATKRK